jgi:hypothetical protein
VGDQLHGSPTLSAGRILRSGEKAEKEAFIISERKGEVLKPGESAAGLDW